MVWDGGAKVGVLLEDTRPQAELGRLCTEQVSKLVIIYWDVDERGKGEWRKTAGRAKVGGHNPLYIINRIW